MEVLTEERVHCLAHAQHRRQWDEHRRDGGRTLYVAYWDAGRGFAQRMRAASCAECALAILKREARTGAVDCSARRWSYEDDDVEESGSGDREREAAVGGRTSLGPSNGTDRCACDLSHLCGRLGLR